MNRAIVTFATGDFDELLEIAWPGFRSYADRHGYDLIDEPPSVLTRPASWGKISRLLSVLDAGYDEVVWIDCDCVILDDSTDLADEVGPTALHAITLHETPDGSVPSCGVWLVRPGMKVWLEAIWRQTRYLNHPWWEQAALHHVLGYGGSPVARVLPSALYDRTHWLGNEWNALRLEVPFGPELPDPRIVHAAPGSRVAVRAAFMRDLAERSLVTKGV